MQRNREASILSLTRQNWPSGSWRQETDRCAAGRPVAHSLHGQFPLFRTAQVASDRIAIETQLPETSTIPCSTYWLDAILFQNGR